MTDMQHPLQPEGLHKMLTRACSYGVPLIITETGAATKDDGVRAKALDSYFKEVSCCDDPGALVLVGHWQLYIIVALLYS
jgi:hypothetical protein